MVNNVELIWTEMNLMNGVCFALEFDRVCFCLGWKTRGKFCLSV